MERRETGEEKEKEGGWERGQEEEWSEENKEERKGGLMDPDNSQTALSVSVCIESNDHWPDFSIFNVYKMVTIGQLTFILIYILFFVLQ